MIKNLNRLAIKNLTDEELTNFCRYAKASHELTNEEFLIEELARRLETCDDENEFLTVHYKNVKL